MSNSETRLEAKAKKVNQRVGGLRPVEPMDLMDIVPLKIDSKPPEPLNLNPSEIWIDGSYQRDLSRSSRNLIMRIIQNFSWAKFKAPVVTRDEQGRYVVIDGQHTLIAAASHPDIKKVPVSFVPMKDVEEQAAAFVSHNTDMVRVTPLDLFYAKLRQGDETIKAVYEATQKHNIQIIRYTPGAQSTYEKNHTMATKELTKTFERLGPAKFDEILNVISQCGFVPIRRDHIVAVTELLYGKKEDRMTIVPKLLVEIIQSLNDTEAAMQAARISKSTNTTGGKALAMVYRNKYMQTYNPA